MDIELIKTLATLPTEFVLIYLIARLQAQNEKLLTGLIESERAHARNLVDIICGGHFLPDAKGPSDQDSTVRLRE